jgi:GINS complex subunit 2
LNYEVLQELLKEEEEKEPFSALPFQWLEISTALLDRWGIRDYKDTANPVSVSDDVVEPDLTRRLLRDLREVRQAKARKGIDTIGDTHLQMDNLGMMEINEIRFLDRALDHLRMLSASRHDVEPEEEENTVAPNGDYGSDNTWDA